MYQILKGIICYFMKQRNNWKRNYRNNYDNRQEINCISACRNTNVLYINGQVFLDMQYESHKGGEKRRDCTTYFIGIDFLLLALRQGGGSGPRGKGENGVKNWVKHNKIAPFRVNKLNISPHQSLCTVGGKG